MTTHARGPVFLNPEARAVLDIGAPHARALRIDHRGKVLGHRMTSQAASGSEPFMENVARYLGVALDDVGDLDMAATSLERASSIYAVTTETDEINMVNRGIATADILDGIDRSIAGHLPHLLRAVKADGTVLGSGSLAQNRGMIRAIEASVMVNPKRRKKVATLDSARHVQSQLAGAIGAAQLSAWRTQQLERMGRFEVVGSAASDAHAPCPGGEAMVMSVEQFISWEGLLSEEEVAVRDMTRRFVADQILPHIVDDFAEGRFRKELALELGGLGILGANLTGYGCPGISHTSYGLACHELEYGDSGLRSFVSVQTSLAMYAIWKWGSEEQKKHWLPEMAAGRKIGCFGLTEPDHGSDPGRMKTRAVRDGDDWLLNGSKMWITSASIADVAIVWAKTGDDTDSMRGFIVEPGSAGFSAHDIPHKLSMRASSTGGLMFDNVRVPDSARLPKAQGLRGPLSCLNNARFGVSWGVLGAARFCLEKATEYSVERQQWGGPIARKQLVQGQLAEMISEVVKASLLSLHMGRLKEQEKLRAPQVSLLKRNNCRIALMCARTARGLLGGNGITGEYHVMRHAMNLESTYTYEGTDEIHSLVLGHALTGERAY